MSETEAKKGKGTKNNFKRRATPVRKMGTKTGRRGRLGRTLHPAPGGGFFGRTLAVRPRGPKPPASMRRTRRSPGLHLVRARGLTKQNYGGSLICLERGRCRRDTGGGGGSQGFRCWHVGSSRASPRLPATNFRGEFSTTAHLISRFSTPSGFQ